jgi:hypothetical protein
VQSITVMKHWQLSSPVLQVDALKENTIFEDTRSRLAFQSVSVWESSDMSREESRHAQLLPWFLFMRVLDDPNMH